MRLKSLSVARQKEPEYIALAIFPQVIQMTDYAKEKAYKINEIVNKIHHGSYEWYGFMIADANNPEVSIDVGLGMNNQNQFAYTKIDAANIDKFRQELSLDRVINGWIHSHGDLGFRQFSGTDDNNQITVLDYVTSLVKKPIGVKEVAIGNLGLLLKDHYNENELGSNSVTIVTDTPVENAKLLETIMGGYSYAVVIGDEGWHEQEIYYKRMPMLSGDVKRTHMKADIEIVETGRVLTPEDIANFEKEIKEKVKPPTYRWWNSPWKRDKLGRFTKKFSPYSYLHNTHDVGSGDDDLDVHSTGVCKPATNYSRHVTPNNKVNPITTKRTKKKKD